jgi:hypothetical protein
MRMRSYVLIRNIVPEGRLLFRALAYGLLAAAAFALPVAGSWWAGLFLAYMAFNLLIGKVVANFSDAIYRVVTRQPFDRNFIRWRNNLELLSEIPDDAYDLYCSGLSPREARDVILDRNGAAKPAWPARRSPAEYGNGIIRPRVRPSAGQRTGSSGIQ